MNAIIDAKQRAQALNPHQSFIVQAPAGSGKTELLTQRILTLLAESVNNPEEIIAITFTRKAASEMRERIISSLHMGQQAAPLEAHKKHTWQLAQKVITKDQKLNWNLINNPNRLRILTIDALSALLNAYTPVLSSLGFKPKIAEDTSLLYRQAGERLLTSLLTDPSKSGAIETVLLHLDNRIPLFLNLCTRLLAKRDQWLAYVLIDKSDHIQLKAILELSLAHIVSDHLNLLESLISDSLWQQIIPAFNHAGNYLQQTNPEHPACILASLTQPLGCGLDDFPYWQALAQLLLTQKYEWRKKLDKRQGFATNSDFKQAANQMLADLAENSTLKHGFQMALRCPPDHYGETQWHVLAALLEILPLLAANLKVIMQEQGMIDFTELSLAALRSLGHKDQPTDLTLQLDYQIKHLLIDEYQDTSMTQFELIETLTAGWEDDAEHSIFFVGDPMQSIYRFRNAEVSLFLRTKQYGINQINCHNLTLKVNFITRLTNY